MASPTAWKTHTDGRWYRQHWDSVTGKWITEWMDNDAQSAPTQQFYQPPREYYPTQGNLVNHGYSSQPATFASSWHQQTYGHDVQDRSASHSTPQYTTSIPVVVSNPQAVSSRRVLPRGEGTPISGLFDPYQQVSHNNLNYEELDSTYFVQKKSFFIVGRVLAVMWNETAGSTSRTPLDYNTSRSLNQIKYKGNWVHTNVRRFVVVRNRSGHCYGCPIFTYTGRATTKPGVRPEEHGIAYSEGKLPILLMNDAGETIEIGITKDAVCIRMAQGVDVLDIASRVYYGIHHPIQYNVRVKDIGMVLPEHMTTLIGNFNEEEGRESGTQQSASTTAYAEVSLPNTALQPVAENPPVNWQQAPQPDLPNATGSSGQTT